jgi:HD-like signal output (HDOD) protein
MAFFCDDSITVTKQKKAQETVWLLLHEIGHYLVTKKHPNRYKNGYPHREKPKKNLLKAVHYVSILEEEIEAWNLGRELSKDLKFKFSVSEFEKYKTSMLKSHITWAYLKLSKDSSL